MMYKEVVMLYSHTTKVSFSPIGKKKKKYPSIHLLCMSIAAAEYCALYIQTKLFQDIVQGAKRYFLHYSSLFKVRTDWVIQEQQTF